MPKFSAQLTQFTVFFFSMFYLCAYLLLALRKLLVVFTCSTNVTYLMKCLVTSSVIQLAGGRKRTKNTFQSSNSLESQCNSNRKKNHQQKTFFWRRSAVRQATQNSCTITIRSDPRPTGSLGLDFNKSSNKWHTPPQYRQTKPRIDLWSASASETEKKNVRFWNNSAGSRRKGSHSKHQNRKLALKRLFFVFLRVAHSAHIFSHSLIRRANCSFFLLWLKIYLEYIFC